MTIINLFLPLIILITILYFLSSYLNRLAARYLSRGLYLFLMWPGVMIHELSHFVGCLLTFTEVKKIELFNPRATSGGMVLGQVSHEFTRNPIKKIIISLAPLFGIPLFILILIKLFLPELYASHLAGLKINISGLFWGQLVNYFEQYIFYYQALWQNFDFTSWQTYLFIYLMLSLGSQIAPSKTDLKYTFEGLGALFIIFIVFYALFKFLKLGFIWQILGYFSYPIYLLNALLGYGIAFSLIGLILVGFLGAFRLIKRA